RTGWSWGTIDGGAGRERLRALPGPGGPRPTTAPLIRSETPMRLVLLLLSGLLAITATGCGGIGTVPVQGVVLFNGKPVDRANVTFLRASGELGPAAIAVTGED